MQYVFKKTGVLIATLLLVSLLAFLAFQIIPGDPTTMLLGTEYSPERAEALRHSLGLDRNVFVRYFEWLTGLFRGTRAPATVMPCPFPRCCGGRWRSPPSSPS